MKVVNKKASLLGVIYSDPSIRRILIILSVMAMEVCISFFQIFCIPKSKRPSYFLFPNNIFISLVIQNIFIVVISYLILIQSHLGGTAKRLIKENGHKLKGKVAVITGGYKGIGLATAKVFLKYGGEVVLACRSMDHMMFVKRELLKEIPGANIHLVELDLRDFESIKKCANFLLNEFSTISYLINNAAVIHRPLKYVNGIEDHFLVNCLGHFYLMQLLYNRILESDTLVVNLSSIAHALLKEKDINFDYINEETSIEHIQKSYKYRIEYCFSKLFVFYLTQELQRRLEKEKTNACAVAVNPGLVNTPLFRNSSSKFVFFLQNFFIKSPYEGCQTIMHVCLIDREKLAKGNYYSDCKIDVIATYADDQQISQDLWKFTEDILKKKLNEVK